LVLKQGNVYVPDSFRNRAGGMLSDEQLAWIKSHLPPDIRYPLGEGNEGCAHRSRNKLKEKSPIAFGKSVTRRRLRQLGVQASDRFSLSTQFFVTQQRLARSQ